MVSRAASPEEEASIYNEGAGLQFTVEFSLVLDAKKAARKNAKRKVLKKSFYVHEDTHLSHMLTAAIAALGREDTLSFCWIPRRDEYTSTTFDIDSMTYTIPKTAFKDMGLTCDKDYEILLKEATKKTVPETIKIAIEELKSETADDDESSEDEGRARGKKKHKTYEPSEEELEQNEIIKNLNAAWKCEDRRCKHFLCFPDRVSAKHVHITHLHLQTWSAAIQGNIVNEDGQAVDLKNPPDTKIFDHQDPDQEDLALVQSRSTKKATANDSNITINLQLPDAALPRQAPLNERPPLAPIQQPTHTRIAPQMTLELFCLRFNLNQSIYDKLKAYSVTGPQTLRHLKNNHLETANLNPAEIADVRDAQDRWNAGEGE
ncbi:hypothetical protein DFH06DRAFT_1369381 [Mycena polygramma]|nr:hypothetical protein DFH06DRAFT_1369381 [Mycena polygramma]